MTTNMPSSRRELRGPRPPHLRVNKASWRGKKLQASGGAASSRGRVAIFYVHSPKVIHTRPQDFMSVVQRLTGKSPSSSSPSRGNHSGSGHRGDDNRWSPSSLREIGARGGGGGEGHGDPLLLTLGSPSMSPTISPSVFYSFLDCTSSKDSSSPLF